MPLKFNPLLRGGFDESKRILDDLEDVSTAGTADGLVLAWEQSSGTWKPAVAGVGDMLKSDYVTGQGTVYNASRLGGETLATVQAHGVDAGTITQGTIGLARVSVMDDAHIPNLETLSYGGTFAEGQIPNLPTSKITTGTFNANRIPALPTSRITTGTFDLNRVPTMDDAHIPNLDTLSGGAFGTAQIPAIGAYKIGSGTFNLARIPSITNAYLAGGITSDKIPALSGTAVAYPLSADSVGTTQIESGGVANAELAASGLDISKFTVGTAGVDRIPVLLTDRYGSAVLVSGTRAMTGNLNFGSHEALNMQLEQLGSHPAAARARIYYDTAVDKVYVYIGTV